MWATVLDFCERALTAALAAVGNERTRVAELERAGWVRQCSMSSPESISPLLSVSIASKIELARFQWWDMQEPGAVCGTAGDAKVLWGTFDLPPSSDERGREHREGRKPKEQTQKSHHQVIREDPAVRRKE